MSSTLLHAVNLTICVNYNKVYLILVFELVLGNTMYVVVQNHHRIGCATSKTNKPKRTSVVKVASVL